MSGLAARTTTDLCSTMVDNFIAGGASMWPSEGERERERWGRSEGREGLYQLSIFDIDRQKTRTQAHMTLRHARPTCGWLTALHRMGEHGCPRDDCPTAKGWASGCCSRSRRCGRIGSAVRERSAQRPRQTRHRPSQTNLSTSAPCRVRLGMRRGPKATKSATGMESTQDGHTRPAEVSASGSIQPT